MSSGSSFGFVQFDFPFALGPEDGRYLVRSEAGAEPRVVIVFRTVGARRRRARRARRARTAEPDAVAITRASVVRARPFESATVAEEWLGALRSDGAALSAEVERAARELNGVIRVHRAVAADPYSRDVVAGGASAARVGHGHGDLVAEGRFESALEVPLREPRRRRVERLSPQEHLAAVLGGREEVLACEELVLRARADIDAGQPRQAALQARIALESVMAELAGRLPSSELAELAHDRQAVSEAGNTALEHDPAEHLQRAVEAAVARMEALVRRHRLRGSNEREARGGTSARPP